MYKVVLLSLMLLGYNYSYSMQTCETNELYTLCQKWFQDSHIRTIASHIMQMKKRRGSFVCNPLTMTVQSTTAQAQLNEQDQIVSIHRLEFPGVPKPNPVAVIQFNEMLMIKNLIDLKDKK